MNDVKNDNVSPVFTSNHIHFFKVLNQSQSWTTTRGSMYFNVFQYFMNFDLKRQKTFDSPHKLISLIVLMRIEK